MRFWVLTLDVTTLLIGKPCCWVQAVPVCYWHFSISGTFRRVSFIILVVVTHVVYASKHTSFSAVAVKFLEFVSKAYIRLNKNPRTNNHVVSFVGKCQMDEGSGSAVAQGLITWEFRQIHHLWHCAHLPLLASPHLRKQMTLHTTYPPGTTGLH